jgi:hypothetical protein
MSTLIGLLLLLGIGGALLLGLLSVIEDLLQRNAQDEPTFREPGPIFHDHSVEQPGARSQFAWQSRSHYRAPD